jgi:hypothetical protein
MEFEEANRWIKATMKGQQRAVTMIRLWNGTDKSCWRKRSLKLAGHRQINTPFIKVWVQIYPLYYCVLDKRLDFAFFLSLATSLKIFEIQGLFTINSTGFLFVICGSFTFGFHTVFTMRDLVWACIVANESPHSAMTHDDGQSSCEMCRVSIILIEAVVVQPAGYSYTFAIAVVHLRMNHERGIRSWRHKLAHSFLPYLRILDKLRPSVPCHVTLIPQSSASGFLGHSDLPKSGHGVIVTPLSQAKCLPCTLRFECGLIMPFHG